MNYIIGGVIYFVFSSLFIVFSIAPGTASKRGDDIVENVIKNLGRARSEV